MALEATISPTTNGDQPVPATLDQNALTRLLKLVGSDPKFVDRLVDAYLADAPRHAAAIRAACDAGDTEALIAPAHTLKGTSLNLGGARVAEIARSIEKHGRTGTLEGVQVLLTDLDAARADLADELERWRARRWSGA